MDLYRLGFHIAQIIALLFLAIKVYGRNKLLQVKFLARVKRRLGYLNKETGIRMDINIKLTDAEKASLDRKSSCCFIKMKKRRMLDAEPPSDQVSDDPKLNR